MIPLHWTDGIVRIVCIAQARTTNGILPMIDPTWLAEWNASRATLDSKIAGDLARRLNKERVLHAVEFWAWLQVCDAKLSAYRP